MGELRGCARRLEAQDVVVVGDIALERDRRPPAGGRIGEAQPQRAAEIERVRGYPEHPSGDIGRDACRRLSATNCDGQRSFVAAGDRAAQVIEHGVAPGDRPNDLVRVGQCAEERAGVGVELDPVRTAHVEEKRAVQRDAVDDGGFVSLFCEQIVTAVVSVRELDLPAQGRLCPGLARLEVLQPDVGSVADVCRVGQAADRRERCGVELPAGEHAGVEDVLLVEPRREGEPLHSRHPRSRQLLECGHVSGQRNGGGWIEGGVVRFVEIPEERRALGIRLQPGHG